VTAENDVSAATADAGAAQVARVYAEALLAEAWDRIRGQETLEELEGLIDLFNQDPQAEAFLCTPGGSRGPRAEAIRAAFAGKVDEIFLNFLLVLNDHDRLDLLRPILAAYRELYDRRQNRVRVEVRSAVPLPEDQLHRLRDELRQMMRREPILEPRVDPELLGGLVIRVEDWLYDASVRARLEGIRDQLIEESSHEIQVGRDRFRSAE
jgi:F-type H+-transporting ATPase subunit delta